MVPPLIVRFTRGRLNGGESLPPSSSLYYAGSRTRIIFSAATIVSRDAIFIASRFRARDSPVHFSIKEISILMEVRRWRRARMREGRMRKPSQWKTRRTECFAEFTLRSRGGQDEFENNFFLEYPSLLQLNTRICTYTLRIINLIQCINLIAHKTQRFNL